MDINQQIGQLTEAVENVKDQLAKLDKDVNEIKAQANKFKGAFIVLLAIGGMIGWISDRAWDFYWKFKG
jgi:hypothetical protein